MQVAFDDILAEPDGIRSLDCVWSCSYKWTNHISRYMELFVQMNQSYITLYGAVRTNEPIIYHVIWSCSYKWTNHISRSIMFCRLPLMTSSPSLTASGVWTAYGAVRTNEPIIYHVIWSCSYKWTNHISRSIMFLQVAFDDILAEPDGIRSLDCVWSCSYKWTNHISRYMELLVQMNQSYFTFYNVLQVAFDDILAEPDGIRSLDCVWSCSYRCFTCWKQCTYMILTTCFGCCIAAEWGVYFAYVAFWHIWYVTPLFKMLEINCGCLQKLYGLCIHCCLDPMCEACGLIFHAFKKDSS